MFKTTDDLLGLSCDQLSSRRLLPALNFSSIRRDWVPMIGSPSSFSNRDPSHSSLLRSKDISGYWLEEQVDLRRIKV